MGVKTVRPNKPVFLTLTKLKFPRMAIVSILHRIAGVVVFLFLPLLLYLLHASLVSQAHFDVVVQSLHWPLMKLLLWVVLAAVLFHLVAGIRHLTMDLGFAESLSAGRATATIVLILSAVLIILAGFWLW